MQAEIRVYFEAEARELIDRLTLGAQSLGSESAGPESAGPESAGSAADEAESIRGMLRAAHTLKGASHVVGEAALATLAHRFEDVLAAYRQGEAPDARAQLLALADELAQSLAEGVAPPAPVLATAPQPRPVASGQSAARMVRVDVAETGTLLAHTSESSLLAGSMRELLERLEALEGTGTLEFRRTRRSELRRELRDDLDRLERQMAEMHRLVAQLRLGSTENLLLEAGRMVRATASQRGKQVRCVAEGAGLRIDLGILESMTEALLHLVRNAIAHGVESPGERRSQGKPEVATITVGVSQQADRIVLTCADDGRGIDLQALRKAALAQGAMTTAEGEQASEGELLALLARPGFKLGGDGAVDEVSGRGVGLDAVREAVQQMNGRLEVQSWAGGGTVFTLSAPQREIALSVLEVSAGGRRYGVPVSHLVQTFRMEAHHRDMLQGAGSLLVGRETMPLLTLQDAFPNAVQTSFRDNSGSDAVAVVVRSGEGPSSRSLALTVDRIVGLTEVLVHPLPGMAAVASYVAGAWVGADGVPAPVLEINELIGNPPGRMAVRSRAPQRPLPLLVIDDSLTTRMLEQSILEAEGYEVELATSAEEGLAMARRKPYALFLVDVEMPGMNGFDFVRTVQADDQLKQTPAILVTSLDSAADREQGRAAGAFSYIVKGEFNQAIYLDRIRSAAGRRTR